MLLAEVNRRPDDGILVCHVRRRRVAVPVQQHRREVAAGDRIRGLFFVQLVHRFCGHQRSLALRIPDQIPARGHESLCPGNDVVGGLVWGGRRRHVTPQLSRYGETAVLERDPDPL